MSKRLIMTFALIVVCGVAPTSSLHAATLPEAPRTPRPLGFELYGGYGIGSVNGFNQIPIGGAVGTTSDDRPKLSELGIHRADLWQAGIQTGIRRWRLDLYYQLLDMSGQDTLSQNLLTHGILFPAGSQVAASTDYTLYHIRVGTAWQLSSQTQLTTEIGEVLFHFNYQISSSQQQTSRTFNHFTPEFALSSRYQLTPALVWQVGGASTIPGLDEFYQHHLYTTLRYYPVYQHYPHWAFTLTIGSLFLGFKDKQTIPNHMKATLAPYIACGIVL